MAKKVTLMIEDVPIKFTKKTYVKVFTRVRAWWCESVRKWKSCLFLYSFPDSNQIPRVIGRQDTRGQSVNDTAYMAGWKEKSKNSDWKSKEYRGFSKTEVKEEKVERKEKSRRSAGGGNRHKCVITFVFSFAIVRVGNQNSMQLYVNQFGQTANRKTLVCPESLKKSCEKRKRGRMFGNWDKRWRWIPEINNIGLQIE